MSKVKITFLGDIMCEPLLMKAAQNKYNTYNFDCVFQNIQELLSESDYVIGNLETPLAGKEAGYTQGLFEFNAPDEFADAVKKGGIDLVSTANNHCLDRGIDGLLRTIRVLDEKGIGHTGTFLPEQKRDNAFFFEIKNTRMAVVSYTYGTNYYENRISLDKMQANMINLLRPQEESCYILNKSTKKPALRKRIWGRFLRNFPLEQQYAIKRALRLPYNMAREDNNLNKSTMLPYIQKMQRDIKSAKEEADFVFFYPHVGGQFNLEPGRISKYVFEKAVESGCDAIIASHPHIVQRAEYYGKVPCFYSLGNFSMSPNSVYLLHENLPDYGIAVHIYIDEGKIIKVTFSILKIVESSKEPLSVYTVDELYGLLKSTSEKTKLMEEVSQIYQVVTGTQLKNGLVKREYSF